MLHFSADQFSYITNLEYEYIYLIRRFSVLYRGIFLRVAPYFGEPVGRVKIQETSKNIPRYYTLNRLIRDLLFNLATKWKSGL